MAKGIKIPYEENHRINKEGVLEKKCNKHHIYFPNESSWIPCTLEYYNKNTSNKTDGLLPQCKKCGSKKAYENILKNSEAFKASYKRYMKTDSWKQYKKENNEKTKDIQAQWRRDNPDKNKYYNENHRDHDISKNEWKACQEFFEYTCAYCGKTLKQQYIDNNEQFHKEHVDHEGYNDVRNCVCSCSNCNSIKRKRQIQELFESSDIKNFTQDKYDKIILWCTKEYKNYSEDKPPYRIMRSRINNKDNTYSYIHELWSVDEKRNVIKCIDIRKKKQEIIRDINNEIITIE